MHMRGVKPLEKYPEYEMLPLEAILHYGGHVSRETDIKLFCPMHGEFLIKDYLFLAYKCPSFNICRCAISGQMLHHKYGVYV